MYRDGTLKRLARCRLQRKCQWPKCKEMPRCMSVCSPATVVVGSASFGIASAGFVFLQVSPLRPPAYRDRYQRLRCAAGGDAITCRVLVSTCTICVFQLQGRNTLQTSVRKCLASASHAAAVQRLWPTCLASCQTTYTSERSHAKFALQDVQWWCCMWDLAHA